MQEPFSNSKSKIEKAAHQLINTQIKPLIDKNPATLLIGISGGVASGKTTFCQILQQQLKKHYLKQANTISISTDCFIYDNQYLQQNNLQTRKGFPETFNHLALQNFIYTLKANQDYQEPLFEYSQIIKDIDKSSPIKLQLDNSKTNIIILEGINLAFDYDSFNACHLLDFNIYLEVAPAIMQERSFERFIQAFENAKKATPPPSYFLPLLDYSLTDIKSYSQSLWQNINFKIFMEHIEPNKHHFKHIMNL